MKNWKTLSYSLSSCEIYPHKLLYVVFDYKFCTEGVPLNQFAIVYSFVSKSTTFIRVVRAVHFLHFIFAKWINLYTLF